MKCVDCHFHQPLGLSYCRAWPEKLTYPHIGCERHPIVWGKLIWHIVRTLRRMKEKYPEPTDEQKSRWIDRLLDFNAAKKYAGHHGKYWYVRDI